MAEIQRLFQPDAAFDPETIEVLAAALDNAWETIEKSGSQFARPAYSRAMREVIAKRIIEMARSGIKDQRQLADDAVRFLEANYNDNPSNRSKPNYRRQRLRTAPTLLSPGNRWSNRQIVLASPAPDGRRAVTPAEYRNTHSEPSNE